MVSLFGLKFGSDKKKKHDRTGDKPLIQLKRGVDQNALGEGQLFGSNGTYGASYAASVYSTARPNTSHSYKLAPTGPPKHALYSFDAHNAAASSMVDLSRPGHDQKSSFSSLKPASSNPNLGMRFNNGSASSLGAPPVLASRPSSSQRQRSWINPLDIHFGKDPLPVPAVKSPLGKRFSLEPASDDVPSSKGMKHLSQLPKPLQINKQKQPQTSQPRSHLRIPPSPPRSITAVDDVENWPILERPIIPAATEGRPSSKSSYRDVPTGMAPLSNSFSGEAHGLPSPPLSLPRASNETSNRAPMNLWGEPIIQNVHAKRETMTISPNRRRSFERLVEDLQQAVSPTHEQRPKTSNGPRDQREYRPKPLDLDLRPGTFGSNSPRSPAYSPSQHAASPYGEGFRMPARTGRPAAAVGAHDWPPRPTPASVPQPAADEYEYSPGPPSEDGSSVYSSDQDWPQSPESPVMPLSGPLASPRFEPVVEPLAVAPPRRTELDTEFRFPDWSALAEDAPPPREKPIAVSTNRAPLTSFDSPNWPLPPSGAGAGRPPPLSPISPISPGGRTQPAFGVPSFSRPWTPNNARPSTPIKTTEITITSTPRWPLPSPRVPPPRVTPDYAFKNPVVLGDGSGSGFI